MMIIFAICFNQSCIAQNKCFQIDIIEYQGGNMLPAETKSSINKKYQRQCIEIGDMQNIVREITNDYIEKGYVTTRVFLPEQNLNGGRLKVEIIEGKIEEVEYIDNKVKKKRHNILPGAQNDILNLRDLEQSVDQMARLRSNKTIMRLKPGTKEGTSIVVIENVQDKKWFVTTGLDNYGSKHKGENEVFINGTLEDILGLSETYSIGHKRSRGDPSKNLMRGYSAAVSVPYGYNTLMLSYAYTNYRSFIQATSQKFKNNGGSEVLKANIERVVHRDGFGKTTIGMGFGHDIYSNYIAGTKIQISSYRINKVDFGVKHHRKWKSTIVGVGINYTQGTNAHYVEKLGSKLYPAHSFNKINYDLSLIRPFALNNISSAIKFTTSLHGQYTPNILPGSEKISIGGFTSVRGFKDSVENTDNGAFLRNEVALGMSKFFGGMNNKIAENIEVFLAYDIGRFSGRDELGKVSGAMSGGAMGVRNTDGILTFDLTLGTALSSKYVKRTPWEAYLSAQINI